MPTLPRAQPPLTFAPNRQKMLQAKGRGSNLLKQICLYSFASSSACPLPSQPHLCLAPASWPCPPALEPPPRWAAQGQPMYKMAAAPSPLPAASGAACPGSRAHFLVTWSVVIGWHDQHFAPVSVSAGSVACVVRSCARARACPSSPPGLGSGAASSRSQDQAGHHLVTSLEGCLSPYPLLFDTPLPSWRPPTTDMSGFVLQPGKVGVPNVPFTSV